MKRRGFFIGLIFITLQIAFFTFWLRAADQPLRETFAVYPLDPTTTYQEMSSHVNILHIIDENDYELEWKFSSSLQRQADLRQDVSLLFDDGYIFAVDTVWKEHSQRLDFRKTLPGKNSNRFDVITLHHAEFLHDQDGWKSSQQMSTDTLYIIDTPLSELHSFKQPSTAKEKEVKKILDNVINEQLDHIERSLRNEYGIPEEQPVIPFIDLPQWKEKSPDEVPTDQVDQMIGFIWETVYHNILLSEEREGNNQEFRGVSMPFITWSKEEGKLWILLQKKEGTTLKWSRPLYQ